MTSLRPRDGVDGGPRVDRAVCTALIGHTAERVCLIAPMLVLAPLVPVTTLALWPTRHSWTGLSGG